jgi:hypothetical protein
MSSSEGMLLDGWGLPACFVDAGFLATDGGLGVVAGVEGVAFGVAWSEGFSWARAEVGTATETRNAASAMK